MTAIHDLEHEARQTEGLVARLRDLCGDDEQAFIDTLDGESDVVEAARRVVRWLAEQDAAATAMKDLAGIYSARSKVFEARVAGAREALFHFLEFLGLPSMPLPEGTISIVAGRPKVVGEPDPESLPDDLVRIKREPDKAAILAALKAGLDVPGCTLSNSPPTLAVRVR